MQVVRQSENNQLGESSNIKNDKELYEIYSETMRQLGEEPEDFYKRNIDIFNNLDEYKQTIWAPSTREIINNQK